MPGAPSSSWALTKQRLRAKFEGADVRVCTAFWLFGKASGDMHLITQRTCWLLMPLQV